jgi:UDP-glucose 4-epimerase
MALTRVLVTGGTGVIGAWVTRGFVERGIAPIVFTRGSTDHVGDAINGDLGDQVVRVRGDLLRPTEVERAIADNGAEAIVHLASAKPWQMERPFVPESRPREALDQITVATLNLLDAAVRQGVRRIVYASSKAVYDHVGGPYGPPGYRPLPEDYPRAPHMLYGIGKAAAEDLGRYYADNHQLEFLAIRFASSFGPLKRGPAAMESWLLDASEGKPIRVRPFLDGQKDDYVYNKDVADGFVRAALADQPRHHAYNLGSGRGIDHNDIAAAIRQLFPAADVGFQDIDAVRAAGPTITDRARCVMDLTRARDDLGYQPRFAWLEDAFADFLTEEARIARQAVAR